LGGLVCGPCLAASGRFRHLRTCSCHMQCCVLVGSDRRRRFIARQCSWCRYRSVRRIRRLRQLRVRVRLHRKLHRGAGSFHPAVKLSLGYEHGVAENAPSSAFDSASLRARAQGLRSHYRTLLSPSSRPCPPPADTTHTEHQQQREEERADERADDGACKSPRAVRRAGVAAAGRRSGRRREVRLPGRGLGARRIQEARGDDGRRARRAPGRLHAQRQGSRSSESQSRGAAVSRQSLSKASDPTTPSITW
jgi:hypothetical protein